MSDVVVHQMRAGDLCISCPVAHSCQKKDKKIMRCLDDHERRVQAGVTLAKDDVVARLWYMLGSILAGMAVLGGWMYFFYAPATAGLFGCRI